MPEIIVKLGDNIVGKYFFVHEPMRIGRSPDNEIVIENLAVSRNHSVIRFEDEHYTLTDLNSSNGTFVNGTRVSKTIVMDRDQITIGKHKLYFYDQRVGEGLARVPTLDASDRTMVVADAAAVPELVVTKGRQKGQVHALSAPKVSVGRGSANDIRLSDWFVSKHHAIIERRGADYFIRDMGSWRKTAVNGQPIDEARLNHGDEIQLGPTVQLMFRVQVESREAMPLPRVPVELGGDALRAGANGSLVVPAAPEIHDSPNKSYTPTFMMPGDRYDPAVFADHGEHDDTRGSVPHAPHEAGSEADADEDGAAEAVPDGDAFNNAFDEPAGGMREGALDDEASELKLDELASELENRFSGYEASAAAEQAEHSERVGDAGDQSGAEPAGRGLEELLLPVPAPVDPLENLVEDMAQTSVRNAVEVATRLPADENEALNEPWAFSWKDTPSPDLAAEADDAYDQSSAEAGQEAVGQASPVEEIGSGEPYRAEPAPAAPATEVGDPALSPEELAAEIKIWERALQNKSAVIRKQAARRLKQLTGLDYEH